MTDFVKKAKLTELEKKSPDITKLATKAALTTLENKKTDYDTKITETEKKHTGHNHDIH